MSFYENSFITNKNLFKHNLNASAHFIFNNNQAHNRGGAIFVEDLDYTIETITQEYDHYFFLGGLVIGNTLELKMDLFNNTAKVAGNEVYGGWIDCITSPAEFNITINDHYAVASTPLRICMCTNHSTPQNTTEKKVNIFPGQTFHIEAVAVGQRYGIVPSIVTAELLDSDGHLDQGKEVQHVGKECTILNYTVYSSQRNKGINLKLKLGG